jgi:hypothetical protein
MTRASFVLQGTYARPHLRPQLNVPLVTILQPVLKNVPRVSLGTTVPTMGPLPTIRRNCTSVQLDCIVGHKWTIPRMLSIINVLWVTIALKLLQPQSGAR